MSRNLRSIQLDMPEQAAEVNEDFYSKESHETKHGTVTTERWADGDYFHVREITDEAIPCDYGYEVVHSVVDRMRPRKISFKTLCKDPTIEPDDMMGPVWQEHDGWEHELEDDRYFEGPEDAFPCRRGYVRDHQKVIIVTDESFCGDSEKSRFNYFHRQGASKQVARELVAQQNQDYIDYLVKCYNEGCEWWWVRLEVEVDGNTYEESCGGIDDYEYARTEMVEELAGNIAYQLEKEGYIITQQPDRRESYLKARRETHKRRLNMFNWR